MSRTESSELRNHAKLVVVVLIALLAGAVWLARRSTEGSSASATLAPNTEHDGSEVPERAERSPATTGIRAPVASGAPTPNAAADSSPARGANFAVLAGRFEFEDGSTPPETSFRLEPFEPGRERTQSELAEAELAAEASGACLPTKEGATESDGRFRVDGLCPGMYTVRLTFSGLGVVEPVLEAPDPDALVVLRGYAVRLRTLTVDGTVAPRATISATFRRSANPESAPQVWGTVSDAAGVANFSLREPGTFTANARIGRRFAPTIELELGGLGHLRDVPLVLDELDPECRLRVRVHGDDAAQPAVADWAIALLDPVSRAQVARLVSEQADEQSRVGDLPRGTFVARLVFRVFDPPACYLLGSAPIETTVTLSPERDADVEFAVPLGGRLSLSARAATADELADVAVQVGASLVPAAGGEAKALDFRLPNASGVLIDRTFPLGEERAAESALPIGDYYLEVRANDFEPDRQRIQIRPGELTRATCVLRRAR